MGLRGAALTGVVLGSVLGAEAAEPRISSSSLPTSAGLVVQFAVTVAVLRGDCRLSTDDARGRRRRGRDLQLAAMSRLAVPGLLSRRSVSISGAALQAVPLARAPIHDNIYRRRICCASHGQQRGGGVIALTVRQGSHPQRWSWPRQPPPRSSSWVLGPSTAVAETVATADRVRRVSPGPRRPS